MTTNVIICPASLVKVWENHLLRYVDRKAYVLNKFHGVERIFNDPPSHVTNKVFIVITSYNLMLEDYKQDKKFYNVSRYLH